MRIRGGALALAGLLVLIGGAPAGALATGSPRARASTSPLTLSASPAQIRGGQTVALRGTLAGAPAGTPVALYESAYPYRGRTLLSTVSTDAAGHFSATARPDRATRFTASATLNGAPQSARAAVTVLGRLIIRARALSLGRAQVTVLVFHPADLRWNGVRAWWRFTSAGQSYRLALRTQRLSRNVTQLRAIIALPAGRYRWQVCMYAVDDHALADPGRPSNCGGRGYAGVSALPAGFPGPGAVAAAGRYLAGRAGRTAFAVIDSEGRLSGVHIHWTFVSASVVKAMLLVAYLRRLDAEGHRTVDSYSNSFLYPMIHVSDNSAATQTWSIVGNSGLYALARAAGMTDYSVYTDWASSQISAADQARFFFEMDSLIPHEFVGYARWLLSNVASYESWGIPAVARPMGYAVFFKGGWRTTGLGQLVHQVARLERPGRIFSIAVMTDGDPDMGYGIDTIQGVTAALLR